LRFQLGVFGVFDYEGWIADDGTEKFLFGNLFEVGEAKFGEEFLVELDGLFVTKPNVTHLVMT